MRTSLRLVFFVALLSLVLPVGAQVLSRRGWVGTGVSMEPWWKRAVFYRIDPALFQDSNGDGAGDLNGIIQRLDYIRKLGVDAIVLRQPFNENDFGDLAIAASRVHLRVLTELMTADTARARYWLNQGAAGLIVDSPALGTDPVTKLRELRHVTDAAPGDRVLLGPPVYAKPGDAPQLMFVASLTPNRDPAVLRRELLSLRDSSIGKDVNPLIELRGLRTESGGGEAEILERTLASMALLSRGAVIFDAGRELGLASPQGKAAVMQWTPANVTRPEAPPEPAGPPKPKEEVYGAYVPYVPPPKFALPAPKAPTVVVSENPPVADPNTLTGFTKGELPKEVASNGAEANAAAEDRSDGSTLNFFRHLIALHHDSAAVRNGTEIVPDETPGAVVWVRSMSGSSVVVAANLSANAVTVDFSGAGLRSGSLRTLLTASTTTVTPGGSSVRALALPAWTLVAGSVERGAEKPAGDSRHRR